MDSSRLIRIREVERLTGLSKSSVYRLEAAKSFPGRLRLSERAMAWRESEVLEWISKRAPFQVSAGPSVAA